jgi:thiosulfate/3-mercaptopyruvate sulfurtransferase
MEKLKPIISAEELLALKNANIPFSVFDVSNEPAARERYLLNHLTDAIFVDVNTDLADINEDVSDGGRHPLPKIENFIENLKILGISSEDHIIIYDYKSGANAAARLWWMLKAIGHEKVQVLDGGFQAAEKLGYPISGEIPSITERSYPAISNWKLPTVEINLVEEASINKAKTIVDVREAVRYKGETEPIDLVAGHIPNAINMPFANHLNTNGTFKSKMELQEIYQPLFEKQGSQNVIIHCGSGVTACHTLLALAVADFEIPNLYVGSWSEWSRNHKPIATNLNK